MDCCIAHCGEVGSRHREVIYLRRLLIGAEEPLPTLLGHRGDRVGGIPAEVLFVLMMALRRS